MHEYALMQGGVVINIVTTLRPLHELRTSYPEYTVLPVMQVPQRALHRYHYWATRP